MNVYRIVDMHTAGEPVRIIVAGYPKLVGRTILDKRREAQQFHDDVRRRLMLEPRGHPDMYGVIPVQPDNSDAALGVLFMHNSGYSTMCGHATIAVGRWAIESGLVNTSSFKLQCPCGIVDVTAVLEGSAVQSVSFRSVPAFLYARDYEVEVDGIGRVMVDIAYGGAYYAILRASELGLDLFRTPLARLVSAAATITERVRTTIKIRRSDDEDLAFIYGTILTDDETPDSTRPTYNLCVFGEGQIDRSPTGTGVTSRMALDFAKGSLRIGNRREFRGASGESFFGTIDSDSPYEDGERVGVRVVVTGRSFYTARSEFLIESCDPLANGFTLAPERPAFRLDHRR